MFHPPRPRDVLSHAVGLNQRGRVDSVVLHGDREAQRLGRRDERLARVGREHVPEEMVQVRLDRQTQFLLELGGLPEGRPAREQPPTDFLAQRIERRQRGACRGAQRLACGSAHRRRVRTGWQAQRVDAAALKGLELWTQSTHPLFTYSLAGRALAFPRDRARHRSTTRTAPIQLIPSIRPSPAYLARHSSTAHGAWISRRPTPAFPYPRPQRGKLASRLRVSVKSRRIKFWIGYVAKYVCTTGPKAS